MLIKIGAETREEVYDRAKREFKSLEIGVSKSVAGYFACVHALLTKSTRHQVITLAREIKRRVLRGLTPRFPDEVRAYTIKCDFDFKDLGTGLARVESF